MVTISLSLIGQKAESQELRLRSVYNRCPITVILLDTIRKNRVLNEPIRFEEIVIFIIISKTLFEKNI